AKGRKVRPAPAVLAQRLAGEHGGQRRGIPTQRAGGDPRSGNRLEADASEIEHQAPRDRALRPTLWLSLPPENQIVRMEIRHSPRLVSQGDCGLDGFGPETGPQDRAKPAQLTAAEKLPHRACWIDHRAL